MAVYEVQGPDGTIYEIEGPPNAKDEQIIGALRSHLQDQRIQGLRAETERLRGLESQVPEAVPERGLFGYAKEIPKGIISGGLGLLETAAVGASALAPDEMEPGIRRSISSVADTLKSPFAASPGYEDTVLRKLSEAGGSTVPLYVMGALGGPAGIAGAVALTAGAGAGEARLRAEGAEATPEQIQTATQLGVGVGLSEMLPVARFTRALGRAGTGSIIDQGKRVLAQAGVEGVQEWAAGVSQNLIAKGVYDPEQGVFTDTGEDLGYGAGVGGIIQGITEMVVGRKVRRAGAQPSQVEDDKQTPDSLILGATQDLSAPVDGEPMIRESAPGIEIAYPAEGQDVGALQEGLGALEGEPAPVTGERRILAPEVESQILQAVPPGLSPEQAAEAIQSIVEDALEGVPQSVKERAISELLGAYQELSAPSAPSAGPQIQQFFESEPGGFTADLFNRAFESLQQGKTTVAGVKEAWLVAAQPLYQSGQIQSAEDLRAFANQFISQPQASAPTPPATTPAPEAAPVAPELTQPVAPELTQPVAPEVSPEAVPPQVQNLPEGVILQNRERSSPASIEQMNLIANNPDYSRVSISNSFLEGAPVVFGRQSLPSNQLGREASITSAKSNRKIPVQYGVVEADALAASNRVDGSSVAEYADPDFPGFKAITNGRVAGLKEGYVRGTMEQYKQDLINDDIHGIDPDVIRAMNNPVLVRVMPQDQVTADIADESNTASTLVLSATEQAKNDANRIDLDGLSFRDDGSISPETVRGFVASMPQAERQGLIDKQGNPSRQAYDRLNAAIFQKAYQNEALVSLAAEAKDQEAVNIINGLSQAAPQMASLDGLGEYDIRPQVAQAAEVAVNARRQGQKLSDVIAQQDFLTPDPVTAEILKLFAENPRSAKKIGDELRRIASEVNNEATRSVEPDMFGDVQPRRPVSEVVAGAPTEVQISPEQEKREALAAFEGTLGVPVPAHRAKYANGRSYIIRPKALSASQSKLILDLAREAVDLGMPASLLSRVQAAGATSSNDLAAITSRSQWLTIGKQWASAPREDKLGGIIHELGHAADYNSEGKPTISESPEWTSAHEELRQWFESKPIKHPLRYPFARFYEGKVRLRQESFAQAFALYFTSPQTLLENAPISYAQVDSFVQGIQNESRSAQTTGTQAAEAAGVDVQQTTAQEATGVQPDAGAVSSSISRTEPSRDRSVAPASIEAGAQGIPQPSTAYQETGIISTSEDVAALNQDIRDEKIKQYQSLKQRLSAIQRRFIKGRSTEFDAAMYRFMYKEAENLKAEIEASREIKDSPEDFMARAAKALADGDIERDVYDVINTMFQQNPDFLDGLRLSIKSPGEAGVAGRFYPLARIIRLFKGTEGVMSPSVVRHELTHSMEQMMPPDVRKKLVDKWRAELEKARNTDQSTQAQKYFDAVVEFIKNPTNENQNKAIKQLPDYRYYQYLNPSEYWAVNAEPLMKSYLGGSWQRFKTSMRGMLEAIKKVLGLSNNSEIYQAFRQAINGERKGTNMLIEYIRSNAPIYQIEHRNYQGNPAPLPTWEMPADTVINTPFGPISKTSGKQKFIDKMVDIVDAQKAIEKKSKQIEDFMDVAGKETLFHGKVARAEEKFMNTDVQPLLQEMKDNQITSQEFGAYALALHAKERNERIARINPKFADGGSGIETARAEAYLARLSPEKRKALESINNKVRKIIEGTQDLEVKYGLTDKATVESGRQIYPNYVPLFRDEVDYTSGGSGLGQGLDVRGATSKRAVGSERAVKDILNSVIEQRQRAIIRGEKNAVGKALYALSIANPNSDFWLPINPEAIKDVNALADEMLSMGLDPKDAENIMQAPKVPQVVRLKDPNTGEYYEQVKYVVSPSANFSENVLSTRVNGQNRYVIFNPNNERARRLVRTLKNLDTEQLDYLTQKMGNVTRWMASMSTQ
jgi:hypothetical protein